MKTEQFDTIIVGAGVAGLNCALKLQAENHQVLVLEASDKPGGRIRTDEVDGFRLDRGFQVLLTAYPECRQVLDFEALALGRFEPGALVWNGRSLIPMMDPLRRPAHIGSALVNPVGSFPDKLRVGTLNTRLMLTRLDSIYHRTESTTRSFLKERGFSDAFIEGFMKPFFRGIFLEEDLRTSSRMFEFVFKMFGQGFAALPAGGMQAIPDQMAARLSPGSLRTQTRVVGVDAHRVITADGDTLQARNVVLATDMNQAAELTNQSIARPWNSTQCLYFTTETSPSQERCILLNGSGNGVISNVAIPSDISPGYAPSGKSLICVSLRHGADANPETAQRELATWFGHQPADFRFRKAYTIPHALPRQEPGDCQFGGAPERLEEGIWVAGDYRYSSSIEGAMRSGKAVAEAILLQ